MGYENGYENMGYSCGGMKTWATRMGYENMGYNSGV